MSERELVDEYLGGKIGAWAFVRRVTAMGVSLGAAVAFAAGLPAAAQSGNFSALHQLVQQSAQSDAKEAAALQRLMQHVAAEWVTVADGGSQKQLGHWLSKLGLNAANSNESEFNLSFNDMARNTPVNVEGNMNNNENELAFTANEPNDNWAINMAGTVGEVPINLDGYLNVNEGGKGGVGHVNLNLSGNAGEVPVNFNTAPNAND